MLIQFTVGNFKSFKDKATLSLEATADDWLEEENIAVLGERRLVKAAGIYGANAGGKSNFLQAMAAFRNWILSSSKDAQAGEKIPITPFRLHVASESAPTFFEAVFLQNGTRYRYGFEATKESIVSEWLFSQGDSIRESRLFTREGQNIDPSEAYKEGKGLEERTRPNALFLSVAAQFNGTIAGEILTWVERFRNISGLDDQSYMQFTARMVKDEQYAELIRTLTSKADVGINDLRAEEMTVETPPSELEEILQPKFLSELKQRSQEIRQLFTPLSIKTTHRKYGINKEPVGSVEFDLKIDESAGTQKFVALTGPFLRALTEGSILFVDELEARLHPLLTTALVGLFNSSANTKNAQLIFATHEERLLDPKHIRRDQVWFVEKDDFGASHLYSLAEFKVRKEGKFAKEYLLGQFGAVPRLGDFEETLTHGRQ